MGHMKDPRTPNYRDPTAACAFIQDLLGVSTMKTDGDPLLSVKSTAGGNHSAAPPVSTEGSQLGEPLLVQ